MRGRFTVIENTPGYLPDSEPAEFDTFKDAVGFARSLKRELREQGYRQDGRIDTDRSTYWQVSMITDDKIYDLGRFIGVEKIAL